MAYCIPTSLSPLPFFIVRALKRGGGRNRARFLFLRVSGLRSIPACMVVVGGNMFGLCCCLVTNSQKQHREALERPNYSVSIPEYFTAQLLIPVKCFLRLQFEHCLLVHCLSSHRTAPSGFLSAISSLLALPSSFPPYCQPSQP